MMNLRPSGNANPIELLTIDTEHFEFVLKGKLDYSKHIALQEEPKMQFSVQGNYKSIQIYDAWAEKLVEYNDQALYPIFFENGSYEVIIVPKINESISFYHEFKTFREAVNKLSRTNLLTGQLLFKNEVGFSTFEIQSDERTLVEITIEVFPTKLNYKKDYEQIILDVNEEIYNLAYHFIKRTYLRGSTEIYKEPSMAEFYRLISKHLEDFLKAVTQIERMPHHQLTKHYEVVRGDQLRKQDSKTRSYLRQNARKLVDVKKGISINGRTVLPTQGLQMKKQISFDTHENRYVKYTMQRIVSKLQHLERELTKPTRFKTEIDEDLLKQLENMSKPLQKKLRHPFWQGIGKLDRSITSLVLQMGMGYREVYQIYMVIAKSIVLQGQLYKMSVKDIATLYEYWTFLKLGSLLKEKCEALDQDIVKVSKEGIFLNLQKDKTATRKYRHKETGELITLSYQYTASKLPTITQKPDSMLSIKKFGKDYDYQYVFDAKYRINVEDTNNPGPKEEDINTMHRYRDSIVTWRNGSYARKAFGAYVLFPWHDEQAFQKHELYQSIESVNIGALPFLPNATALVSKMLDHLLAKTSDELQDEGILPIGTNESFMYEQQLVETKPQIAAEQKEQHHFNESK